MIVVDANIIVYLVTNSAETPLAERVSLTDPDWRAPRLWRSEVLNALSGYIRKGMLTVEEALLLINHATRVLKAEALADPRAVLHLVSTSHCSSYDCEYIAAARELRVPLVTADKQVLASFPDTAVSMLDFLAS